MRVLFLQQSYENLGIEYLSAVLKENKIETGLAFDPFLFQDGFIHFPTLHKIFSFRKEVLKKIYIYKPDLIAISVTSGNAQWMISYCREIRRFCNCPIVVGGIYVSSIKEKILNIPFVDYGIIGEGEESLLELCNHIKEYKTLPDTMKNLVYRDAQQNPKFNSPRNLLDLEKIPYPDKELYKGTAISPKFIYTALSSRGCPFNCSFCNNSVIKPIYNKSWYRIRSAEGVIEELKCAKEKYNPKIINFYDEIFGFDVEWLEKFVDLYNKFIAIPYMCCTKPSIVSKRYVELLKESKCIKVDMGVQTIIEEHNKNIFNRNDKREEVENAIKRFKENKIVIYAENIINYPGEEEKDLKEVAYFYNNVRPSAAKFFFLAYYPSAKILAIAEKYSILDMDEIEKINSGNELPSFTYSTNSKPSGIKKKYYFFLIIMQRLPHSLVKLILDMNLVKFFPPISIRFSYIVMRFLRRGNSLVEAVVVRHLYQYLKYIILFIVKPVTRKSELLNK